MKKYLFFSAYIFMLLILGSICVHGQDIPKRTDGSSWFYGTYSPKANFSDLYNLGLNYFQQYKESDSSFDGISLYNRFKSWSDIVGSRSVWADYPDKTSFEGALKATADLNAAAVSLPSSHPYSNWKLKGATESPVQNLGTVTSIWQNPSSPGDITLGTEASGIWKLNPAGNSWSNISDSYTGSLTGFGVSSLVKNGSSILAGTFNPSMDLFIGEGVGLIYSPDNGVNWTQLLPDFLLNSSFLTGGIIWKVARDKFLPSAPHWYFCLGDTIYNFIPGYSSFFFNPIYKIGVPHINDHSWMQSRIRDFEFSDSLYSSPSLKDYHALCFSTDGFSSDSIVQNAELFYQFRHFSTPFHGSPSQLFLPFDSVNNFIQYIAIEQFTSSYHPDNTFYITYNEVSKTNPHISRIHIGTLKKDSLYVNSYSQLSYKEYFYAPVTNHIDSPFAGFGYRYNDFKISTNLSNLELVIPGYYITLLRLDDVADTVIPPIRVLKPNLTANPHYNYFYNDSCHIGIRALCDNFDVLVGNEGGISKLSANDSWYEFTNYNHKGLAIAQVKNLSTSKYSPTNALVHSSFRNGYWAKACDYPWHSTAFMDGGSAKVLDNQLDYNSYLYGFGNSPTNLMGITNNEFYNQHTGASFPDQLYFSSNAWLYEPAYCITPMKNIILSDYFGSYWSEEPCTYAAPLAISPGSSPFFLQGRHNIFRSDDPDSPTWTKISDTLYGYPKVNHWSRALQAIEFAPGSSDTLFAVFSFRTDGKDENGSGSSVPAAHKIYRGEKQGSIWQWKDLTNDSLPYILQDRGLTDIAVNPNNSNELWITLDQYSGHILDGKFRVMHSVDGGQSWTDYSTGLSCVPVSSIVLNKESSLHDLYVGTDMGVFFRNDTMNSWMPYMHNLPRCMVMDLEIDYDRMELNAATWGRSIWVSPIPCYSSTAQDITVDYDQSWSQPVYNCGNITVKSGSTLSIHTTVQMALGTEIRVEPGALLNLYNATLTNSCRQYWKGIVLQANHNYSIFYDPHMHAQLFSYNSTIANSLIAIQTQSIDTSLSANHGGGEISCNQTTFLNNALSVKMRPYANKNPQTFVLYDELTAFNGCDFIYDENYILDSAFVGFVLLDSINFPKFNGCSFKNEYTSCSSPQTGRKGFGIKANKSAFVAQATFENLQYGIYALNMNVECFSNLKVDNCIFNQNTHGIFCHTIVGIKIYNNEFIIPERNPAIAPDNPEQPYGLYTEYCDRMKIEGNYLHRIPGYNTGYMGMVIVNSHETIKILYNNTFNYLDYALLALGDNGNRPTSVIADICGLKVKCNDFSDCGYDIAVRPIPGQAPELEGISVIQGELAYQPDSIMLKTANNRFSHSGTGGTSDIHNTARFFTYYHNSDYSNTPVYYSMDSIFPIAAGIPGFDKELACPPLYILPPPSEPIHMGDFDILDAIIVQCNNLQLLYRIYVDGGRSEALQEDILLCYPWEAYVMFDELMAISPYLSDESMINVIRSEDIYPPVMVRLLLLANPQCLRTPSVWDAIYQRKNPLPEEIILELESASEDYSPKPQMEAAISELLRQKYDAFDNLVERYILDPQPEIFQNILSRLQQQKEYCMGLFLIEFYLKNKMFTQAELLINSELENYHLHPLQESEWQELKQYYQMLLSAALEEITPGQLQEVWDMTFSQFGAVASGARSLYKSFHKEYALQEIILLPETAQGLMPGKKRRSIVKQPGVLQVSPNPAHDFITVSYQLPDEAQNATVCISDVTGRKYKCKPADKSGSVIIGLGGLVKGIYICTLEANNAVIKSVKFAVY